MSAEKTTTGHYIIKVCKVMLALTLIVGILGMIAEEMTANTGPYKRTLWDVISFKPKVPVGQAQISVQLAQEICRQKIVQRTGNNFIQATYDRRSSRYSTEYQVHTIFMDVQLKDYRHTDIYARCDVSAVKRIILEFRLQGLSGFLWGGM